MFVTLVQRVSFVFQSWFVMIGLANLWLTAVRNYKWAVFSQGNRRAWTWIAGHCLNIVVVVVHMNMWLLVCVSYEAKYLIVRKSVFYCM
jgi:hypothetical protein